MRVRILGGIAAAVILVACGKKDDPVEPAAGGQTTSGKQAAAKAEPLTVESTPRPEGTEFVMATADTRTIMLRGPALLDASKTFFETELAKLGWQKDESSSEVTDGVGFLDFSSGDLRVTVTLNPDRDGKTMTYMLQGSGISVPEEEVEE